MYIEDYQTSTFLLSTVIIILMNLREKHTMVYYIFPDTYHFCGFSFICVVPRWLWQHFSLLCFCDSSFLSTLWGGFTFPGLPHFWGEIRSLVFLGCNLLVFFWLLSRCVLFYVDFFPITRLLYWIFLGGLLSLGFTWTSLFVNLCVSPNLKTFQSLFIQIFFSASTFFFFSRTPWMLDFWTLTCRSPRLC